MSLIEVTVDAKEPIAQAERVEKQTSDTGLLAFQNQRVWPWLAERTAARFASEGDEASGEWAQLLASTNNQRRRQGFPPAHPINVRTGDLRAYAQTKTIERQAGGITLSQPMKGGSRQTQLKFNHAQRGGQTRPGAASYPPRPVVALGDLDQWEITTRLMRWIMEGGTP